MRTMGIPTCVLRSSLPLFLLFLLPRPGATIDDEAGVDLRTPCNAHGAKNLRTGACACDANFFGPQCQLTKDASGQPRFVGLRHNAGAVIRPRCEPKICQHGGLFNRKVCKCDCELPWLGDTCTECIGRTCGPRQIVNQATCSCDCADKSPKCNHGKWNTMTCTCDCDEPYSGLFCNACASRTCYHGGLWNSNTCQCDCSGPWDSADDCRTCPRLDCQNGGDFDPETCECRCKEGTPWTGELCDKCPDDATLVLQDKMGCAQKEFDRATCSCKCQNKECLNGGVLNTDTCACACNGDAGADPAPAPAPPAPHAPPADEMKKATEAYFRAPAVPGTTSSQSLLQIGEGEREPTTRTNSADDVVPCRASADRCTRWTYEPHKGDAKYGDICRGNGEGHVWECPTGCEDAKPNRTAAPYCTMGASHATPAHPYDSSAVTHWSGPFCNVCNHTCQANETLMMDNCTCLVKCDLREIGGTACHNGGTFNRRICGCTCVAGYQGPHCDERATGEAADGPATSCRTANYAAPHVKVNKSLAKDGIHWLVGNAATGGKPWQANCDQTTDGGGWVQLANVGKRLSQSVLSADTYRQGTGSVSDDEFILPCRVFNGIDGDTLTPLTNFVLRVTMGNVRDYFRPANGSSLCDMLTSQDKHLFASNIGRPENAAGTSLFLQLASSARRLRLRARARARRGRQQAGAAGARRLLQDKDTKKDSKDLSWSEALKKSLEKTTVGGGPAGEAGEQGEAALVKAGLPSREERKSAAEAGETVEGENEDNKRQYTKSMELADGAAYDLVDRFKAPEYETDTRLKDLLGGCARDWPKEIDGRTYISFWGGDKGGCCHYTSRLYPGSNGNADADKGGWGREFQLHVVESMAASGANKIATVDTVGRRT